MSYPNYPTNRLIAGDTDLTSKYGLILADGYTIDPPEPKTYEVDIPGGDGVIDLTDSLLGDVAYKNRNMEFDFYIVGLTDDVEFEEKMTAIKQFLHGRKFDFNFTMDPNYKYCGRFTISGIKHSMHVNGIAGYFKLSVDANPYKYIINDPVYRIDAIGGTTVYFESGRKRVRPTIETEGYLRVIFNNKLYELTQGAWTINDILFKEGNNEIYFCSYDIKNLTWGELKNNGITCSDFQKKRLHEWYRSNGDGTQVIKTWNQVDQLTWTDLSDKKWSDMSYMSEITKNVQDIYVKYKVGEL